MGALYGTYYASKYPTALEHVILVSPAGVHASTLAHSELPLGRRIAYALHLTPMSAARAMGPLGPRLVRWMMMKRVSWTPPSNAIRMGELNFELFAKYCYHNWALKASGDIAVHTHLHPVNFTLDLSVRNEFRPSRTRRHAVRGAAVSAASGAARTLPLAVDAGDAAGAHAGLRAAADALGARGTPADAAAQAHGGCRRGRRVGAVPVHPAYPRAAAGLAAGHDAGTGRPVAAAATQQPARPRGGDRGARGLRHCPREPHEPRERHHREGHRGRAGSALLRVPGVAVCVQPAFVAAVGPKRAGEGGEENLRTYAVEWKGIGRSDRPKWHPKTDEEMDAFFVESLEDWRQEVNLDRFILCGHSMGVRWQLSCLLENARRRALDGILVPGKLQVPLTIMYGGGMDWMNSEYGEAVIRRLEKTQYAVFRLVPISGHQVFMDNPSDFNQMLIQAVRDQEHAAAAFN
ncbi:unnamed protein product [Phytophthora lilii]|uniref:Unnamed protein product n=1 Tax=Phytophthora lilii TaxID=2077276 RepID=A0A9W6U8H1_9STRA|nr:unnamed protein product [Phytophthora lilii]